MNKAKKILLALQEHLNVKSFKELASIIGVSETLLYSWVRHGNIAGTGKILAVLPHINLSWLETGEGPMFNTDTPPLQPPRKRLVATLEQGYNNQNNAMQEPTTKTVRMYRELAEMDADTLGEIQTWLNDMERLRPGYTGWFRLEFQNRFPEFDEWKLRTTKKQQNG